MNIKKNKELKKYNTNIKSRFKNMIKKINNYIKLKDYLKSKELFIKIQSFIDKISKKNIIKRNKCSRIKSKLFKKINFINKIL